MNTTPLTCSRCGLADISVVTRDNGVPHHVSPMKCIAALKRALTNALPPEDTSYVLMSEGLIAILKTEQSPPIQLHIEHQADSRFLVLRASAFMPEQP